jgi:uncharacterized DUF497 family protein
MAFDDPLALTTQDRDIDGEQRYHLIGTVFARIIPVAHVVRTKSKRVHAKTNPSFESSRKKSDPGGTETL